MNSWRARLILVFTRREKRAGFCKLQGFCFSLMPHALDGQHALIAGGSGEMGFYSARALVDVGCRVSLLARGSEGLTTAATRLINEVDGDVQTVTADLTHPATIRRAVDHAIDGFGKLDIVVYALRDDVYGAYDQLDPARVQMAMNNLLIGAGNLMAATLPAMQAAGHGHVVFVLGQDAMRGRPLSTANCMILHGLVGMMRALAREVAESGVVVNAISAGLLDTDRLAVEIDQIVAHTRRDRSAVRADLAAGNPQRRLIAPTEVGEVLQWLTDPGNRAVTGQVISVDGGELS